MNLKKGLSLVLSFMLLMSIFVGCTPDELEYYKLTKEMQKLQQEGAIETTGEMSLDLDLNSSIYADMEKEEADVLKQVISEINKYTIAYSGKMDAKNSKADLKMVLKDAKENKEVPLLSVIQQKDKSYVKMDDLFAFMKSFGNEEVNKALDDVYGDTQYISMSNEELINFFTNMNGASNPAQMAPVNVSLLQKSLDPEFAAKQQEIYNKFVDGAIDGVYKDFETKVIKKNENKYVISLKVENTVDFLVNFITYSVQNSEALANYMKKFVTDLEEEELQAIIGMATPEKISKDEVIKGIDEALVQIESQKEEMEALPMMKTMILPELKKTLGDTAIEVTLEKKEEGSFETTADILLDISEPTTGEKIVKAKLAIKETLKKAEAFEVAAPTEKVMTFTELEAKIPTTINIYEQHETFMLQKGFATNTGDINVELVEGRMYLPMRQIAEAFGETVIWDEKESKAYVQIEDEKVLMAGFVKEGRTYIKVRDFEKLGYTVEWNAETHTATIIKLNH